MPEIISETASPNSNPKSGEAPAASLKQRISRRGLLGRALSAAGLLLLAKTKPAKAQVTKPIPGHGPDKSEPQQPSPKTSSFPEVKDPASAEAQMQEKSVKLEQRASFESVMEELAIEGQKVLSATAKPVMPIKTNHFIGSEKTSATGYLVEQPGKPLSPSVMAYLKDVNSPTIETATVLTAKSVAKIMDEAYGKEFSRVIDVVSSGIRNNLSQSDRLKLKSFFEIPNFINGSVEIDELQGDTDAEMLYTKAYALLRCKSGEVIKKLQHNDLSPAVKEGLSIIFLTALKTTTHRLNGTIPPKDLGFNESHIKELIKMTGNKVNFNFQ